MSADIDLDLADREQVLKLIRATPARQMHQGQVRRHNSGIYVTDIPYDPINECAAIDYEVAEERGYFKIDLLNVGIYNDFESNEQIDWLLRQKEFIYLGQGSGHKLKLINNIIHNTLCISTM